MVRSGVVAFTLFYSDYLIVDSLRPDINMVPTYSSLAERAATAARNLPPGEQWWCCIAGGPGAGKSTLCEQVAALCAQDFGVEAVVLSMDGFHYSREELKRLDPPDASTFLPRRGAPHTFDAEGLFDALQKAKATKTANMPTYSRELSDPVPGGAVLTPQHKAVFVEGNYLLLGELSKRGVVDGCELDEARRWQPLLPLFDESWFVVPVGGVPEQRRRLVTRHLETWSDAKTKAWGAETAEEGAAKRTDFNDVPNAFFIDKCRPFADVIVESV
jgi:pantothenate kinase